MKCDLMIFTFIFEVLGSIGFSTNEDSNNESMEVKIFDPSSLNAYNPDYEGSKNKVSELKPPKAKRKLDFGSPSDSKVLKFNSETEIIPAFIKFHLTSSALNIIIYLIDYLTLENSDLSSQTCLHKLLPIFYEKLKDKNHNLVGPLLELTELFDIENSSGLKHLIKCSFLYSSLFDQTFLIPALENYHNLILQALSYFKGKPKNDYFVKFWDDQILDSARLEFYEDLDIKTYLNIHKKKVKALISEIIKN